MANTQNWDDIGEIEVNAVAVLDVPFDAVDADDIGVRLTGSDGVEIEFVRGRDYAIYPKNTSDSTQAVKTFRLGKVLGFDIPAGSKYTFYVATPARVPKDYQESNANINKKDIQKAFEKAIACVIANILRTRKYIDEQDKDLDDTLRAYINSQDTALGQYLIGLMQSYDSTNLKNAKDYADKKIAMIQTGFKSESYNAETGDLTITFNDDTELVINVADLLSGHLDAIDDRLDDLETSQGTQTTDIATNKSNIATQNSTLSSIQDNITNVVVPQIAAGDTNTLNAAKADATTKANAAQTAAQAYADSIATTGTGLTDEEGKQYGSVVDYLFLGENKFILQEHDEEAAITPSAGIDGAISINQHNPASVRFVYPSTFPVSSVDTAFLGKTLSLAIHKDHTISFKVLERKNTMVLAGGWYAVEYTIALHQYFPSSYTLPYEDTVSIYRFREIGGGEGDVSFDKKAVDYTGEFVAQDGSVFGGYHGYNQGYVSPSTGSLVSGSTDKITIDGTEYTINGFMLWIGGCRLVLSLAGQVEHNIDIENFKIGVEDANGRIDLVDEDFLILPHLAGEGDIYERFEGTLTTPGHQKIESKLADGNTFKLHLTRANIIDNTLVSGVVDGGITRQMIAKKSIDEDRLSTGLNDLVNDFVLYETNRLNNVLISTAKTAAEDVLHFAGDSENQVFILTIKTEENSEKYNILTNLKYQEQFTLANGSVFTAAEEANISDTTIGDKNLKKVSIELKRKEGGYFFNGGFRIGNTDITFYKKYNGKVIQEAFENTKTNIQNAVNTKQDSTHLFEHASGIHFTGGFVGGRYGSSAIGYYTNQWFSGSAGSLVSGNEGKITINSKAYDIEAVFSYYGGDTGFLLAIQPDDETETLAWFADKKIVLTGEVSGSNVEYTILGSALEVNWDGTTYESFKAPYTDDYTQAELDALLGGAFNMTILDATGGGELKTYTANYDTIVSNDNPINAVGKNGMTWMNTSGGNRHTRIAGVWVKEGGRTLTSFGTPRLVTGRNEQALTIVLPRGKNIRDYDEVIFRMTGTGEKAEYVVRGIEIDTSTTSQKIVLAGFGTSKITLYSAATNDIRIINTGGYAPGTVLEVVGVEY